MVYRYFQNSAEVLGLWLLMGTATVVVWGMLTWVVVNLLRHSDTHGDCHPDRTAPDQTDLRKIP